MKSKSKRYPVGKYIPAIVLCLTGFLGSAPSAWADAAGNTLYVDALATGNEGDGSAANPFKTIQTAADAAQPGDTVIVKAGVYRESIVLKHGGTADASIVFKASPLGSAIVDGSVPVTGFESNSTDTATVSIWYCPTYKPSYGKLDDKTIARWTKQGAIGIEAIERNTRQDMLWLDGKHLNEVASKDQLTPGTYWLDHEKGGFYLALDKGEKVTDHLVEASVLMNLLTCAPDCSYIQIKGFHFTKAAAPRQGTAVEIGTRVFASPGHPEGSGRGWVFEGNLVDWNGFTGVTVHGFDHQIVRNVIEWNGDSGIGGSHCHNVVLDGNISRLNNWKGINPGFEGGGGKFAICDNVTIRNHEACYNFGPGIWFDTNNSNIHIEHCLAHENKGAGIFIEISQGPVEIDDNICYGNLGSGIGVAESSNVTVEHNVLAVNYEGIGLRNLQNRTGPPLDGATKPEKYQLSDLTIRGNYFLENSKAGIVNTDKTIDTAASHITSDNNTFSKTVPVWWKIPDNSNPMLSNDGNFTPPESDGYWVFASPSDAFKKIGLEEHSQIKGLDFSSASIFEYPWPDQIKPGN